MRTEETAISRLRARNQDFAVPAHADSGLLCFFHAHTHQLDKSQFLKTCQTSSAYNKLDYPPSVLTPSSFLPVPPSTPSSIPLSFVFNYPMEKIEIGRFQSLKENVFSEIRVLIDNTLSLAPSRLEALE
ncbi:hypothetical protein ACTXT7_001920 [Hymenolepis weldensis]